MIRWVYLLAGRAATPFALIGLKVFTKLTGRERVRVLVTNEQNQVLLLKGVLSDRKWTLPGGGVNRNESAIAATRRELHEETGILLPETAFTYVATLSRPNVAIAYNAPLFSVSARRSDLSAKMVNPYEVAAIAWFNRDQLPAQLSEVAAFALSKKSI